MSAPRPRRPSTTVAIRSDSLSAQLLGAGDDRLALGEAAEQRDQRELVDRERDLVRLDDRADERAGGDVELADRLVARDLAAPRRLEVADDDGAHPLGDPDEPGAGPVRAHVGDHDPRALDEDRRGDVERGRRRVARHVDAPSSSSSCWVSAIRSPSRRDAHAGAGEQALGVVAARLGLDHRRRPRGQQARHQHARLDLRGGDRQRRTRCPRSGMPWTVNGGEAVVGGLDPRAHLAQRLRDAVDGAAADRRVAVERPLAAGLAREPAGQRAASACRRCRRRCAPRGRAQPGAADRQRAAVGALLDQRAAARGRR